MNADDTSGSRISRALAQRGFTYKGRSRDRWYLFDGSLSVDGASYPVRLAVDPLGQALPLVKLTPIPERLRPVAPHVMAGGNLCYASSGSITLDIFDPEGQVLACVGRAENVLGQVLRGELTDDLEEEFFSCWPGDNPCLLDFDASRKQPLHALVQKVAGNGPALVALTDDPSSTSAKLQALGASTERSTSVVVRRLSTTVSPRPLQDSWPPKTVSDLLRWQGALDSQVRRKIEQFIHRAAKTRADHGILCVVESPKLTYAFAVTFDRPGQNSHARLTTLESVYAMEVVPMTCIRIDDTYLAQRNIPGRRTLVGKRIMLIGCGTIGGYLAESLVKAGAGSGGGELVLVDFDHLFPQNIGRHRLGMNYLFHKKAVALAQELKRGAPAANISPLPTDAMRVDLSRADLIVDATGEEALGHLLVRRLSESNFKPTLSVWIEGPGTAVRSLFRESNDAACVRCLKDNDRKAIYPVVDGVVPTVLAGHGCESLYVPFPASVSMHAACLGTEMVLEWANGVTTPRLRTRVLDAKFQAGHKDTDPERRLSCPACLS
ncbi:ThiF family adenylyltransferase [Paraburkholderia nemoris]|uniref:ThiF family adenylyltransferase n=1 Tax=Paraburkholderia nemoris TaxID=2793076 RepID=UPI0038B90216